MNESAASYKIGSRDAHFGVFYELMAFKVREILLVSSAYDAFIMEEDGSLAMRIINEYQGLNLSRPPRITSVSTVEQAMGLLEARSFDLVLTMPNLGGMDCNTFAARVKEADPKPQVILLAHSAQDIARLRADQATCFIDHAYVWGGDSNLLLAIVKNVEDRRNVDYDTQKAMVRVILYVEDSPAHRSLVLPILYNEVVRQTQAILDEGLNDQHRLLKMRARPKILTASSYEEALELFNRYRQNIYALLTDVRFVKGGVETGDAGMQLIEVVRREAPDLPALILSAEAGNEEKARLWKAMFALKDAATIRERIHVFFLNYLGFGDFIFRRPGGAEICRAANLLEFERMLGVVPGDCLMYHARRNHFSNWMMARAEVALASRLNKRHFAGVEDAGQLREDIVFKVHSLRKLRQKGVVVQFSRDGFDPETADFVRIGQGSLGGKARGIAFVSSQLHWETGPDSILNRFMVRPPQTCVITTSGFDDFIARNGLVPDEHAGDAEIAARFERAELPGWLRDDLRAYLEKVDCPLSVRSSGMLEDAQFHPYAGLYSTFMLANSAPDFEVRFNQLVRAVKLVYASTWFEGPRSFSRSVGSQGQDSMAVIIQRLAGRRHGDFFYPAVSGTVQSYNYYPLPPMAPEDGIAHIALGFGKTVVEGERSLRFSPRYPQSLPQLSTPEDMLRNSQRWFYSLDCTHGESFHAENSNLVRRDLDACADEHPVRLLTSTYFPEEQRVRDVDQPGPKVMTFASLLKYDYFPLAGVLKELVELGREGMGCEVEMEFALDLDETPRNSVLYFLQIRPIARASENRAVRISEADRENAVLFSGQSLGHGLFESMRDIVYVKPEAFDAAATREIAAEIGRFNRSLGSGGEKFLLIGFGRWGTADPWLGIPVKWHDISGAGAIVEIQGHGVVAEPSQGTHFFQNITSLGIPYLMIREDGAQKRDKVSKLRGINWTWLKNLDILEESEHVCHVRLNMPLILKVNGYDSESVLLAGRP